MFSNEVSKLLEFYVYRLIDPRNGDTFYIGKGKGNRVFHHAKGADIHEDGELIVPEKIRRIREIIKSGLEVQHIIHRHGMDEKTSFEVEAALIDAYPGNTNLMNGHGSNDRGVAHAQQIINRYTARSAVINHKIIEIIINNTSKERSTYDSVRYAWKISPERASKAEYILAVDQGIIIDVFIADEWISSEDKIFQNILPEPIMGRYGFTGRQAPESILKQYLNCSVPPRPKGAANPIKYHNV